jgi:L-asparagine transporter-like permease
MNRVKLAKSSVRDRRSLRLCLPAQMQTPAPRDPSQAALRSLIWRVVVFFVAGLVVIAAFVIAWRVGAFAPSRP